MIGDAAYLPTECQDLKIQDGDDQNVKSSLE